MDLTKYCVKEVCKEPSKGLQIIKLDNGQIVHLKQSWYNSIIEEGDLISINLDKKEEKLSDKQLITIDDKDGYLILNPDHLITITDLSNLSFCFRKTWLNNRFKPIQDSRYNHATLLGTLIHELFQITINEKKLTKENLVTKLIELIEQPSILRSLDYLKLTPKTLINDSKNYVDSIISFNEKFNSDQPAQFDQQQPNLKLKINKVTDIEDTIVCPKLGLKGKIDVRLDVEIHNNKTGEIRTEKSIPFELKTGRVSFSFAHQAQVNLYTLMVNNLSNSSDFGLLAYLKDGLNLRYITVNNYIRNGLLQQRNELVHYLKYLKTGPDTKTNTSFCSKCEHIFDCCLMGKIYEANKLDNFYKHQPDLVPSTLSHLDKKYIDFFSEWIEKIFLEEQFSKLNSKNNYFWNKKSIELEKNLQSIAKLVLHSRNDELFEYVFIRSSKFKEVLGSLPVDIQFNRILDRITLSIESENDELERIGFVNGVILNINDDFVTLKLDEHLKDEFNDKLFRLDIYLYQANYSIMYTSILRLMYKESNSQFLRSLLIDKVKPKFNNDLCTPQVNELLKNFTTKLNVCQRDAVLKSIKMEDYLLIKGYPGSGKTETIVHIVRLLAELGKTVLITAHTNQAVDNILLKLLKYNLRFMRIGNLSKIDSELIKYSEDFLFENCTTKDEFDELFKSVNIFASTCYSINSHILFEHRIIEYCILDEASQLDLPESLIPLFSSLKFILVGDPEQLPPIVQSSEAKEKKLDKTLFDILYENNYEDSCVELRIQYRMNNEIMRIANLCTYDNKLVCASQEIANKLFDLTSSSSSLSSFLRNQSNKMEIDDYLKEYDIKIEDNLKDNQISNETWLETCLNNSELKLSVIFLNTDNHLDAKHQIDNNGQVYNDFELNIITKILNYLNEKNFNMNDIGIISPYNRQVKLIKCAIKSFKNVECSTIDQYQGRDKSIIIISCVKSDKEINISPREILNDKRRINVAITRAKHKLIICGSLKTLINYEPISKLVSCLDEKQIIEI